MLALLQDLRTSFLDYLPQSEQNCRARQILLMSQFALVRVQYRPLDPASNPMPSPVDQLSLVPFSHCLAMEAIEAQSNQPRVSRRCRTDETLHLFPSVDLEPQNSNQTFVKC